MKQVITEEMNIQEKWRKEAEDMTMEKLPEFLRKLTEDYIHDYGTIVHAILAGMNATFNVMNRSEQGGITGFQASYIGWEMVEKYLYIHGDARILEYEDMLFPQMSYKFNTITPKVWKWLKEEAEKRLNDIETSMSVEVVEHMQKIVDGEIPFGYSIVER